MAIEYRSKKRFRTEPGPSMGVPIINVIGIDDNMVYAVLNEEDFARQYEIIPEEEPPVEEPTTN